MSTRPRLSPPAARRPGSADFVAPENTELWSHNPDLIAEVLTAVDIDILSACCSVREVEPLVQREKWYSQFAFGWILRYSEDKDMIVSFVYIVRLAKVVDIISCNLFFSSKNCFQKSVCVEPNHILVLLHCLKHLRQSKIWNCRFQLIFSLVQEDFMR